jgi:carbonic anhydrase/acetyltransferase-like protein (isoleucine patch superfamily)
VRIGANCVIRNATIGAGTKVAAFSQIEDTVMGEACVIGPYARTRPGTVLGADVHLGNFVEVKNSNIADHSKANHLAYVGDADIGQRVNVGAGTITCNYDGANKFRTIIEDDVFIGSDTQLVAPVRVRRHPRRRHHPLQGRPAEQLTVSRAKQVSVAGWKRPVKPRKPDPHLSAGPGPAFRKASLMCGIVTAIARRNIVPVLLEGLRKLEYRGYDSAGLAVLKTEGKPELSACAPSAAWPNWPPRPTPPACPPTSASPTPAGPPTACPPSATPTRTSPAASRGAQRHHRELRRAAQRLQAKGYAFTSETDTEAIAHLLHDKLKTIPDLFDAVRATIAELVGAYAIGVVSEADPTAPSSPARARRCCWASAKTATTPPPTPPRCCRSPARWSTSKTATWPSSPSTATASPSPTAPRRAPGEHLQPVGRRRRAGQVPPLHAEGDLRAAPGPGQHPRNHRRRRRHLPQLFGADAVGVFGATRRVLILACGTSYHAGLVARYWIESVAKLRAPSRSPANTATANPCPTPTPWSSSSPSPAKPPTPWPPSSTPRAWA